jgi:hypothetical protein
MARSTRNLFTTIIQEALKQRVKDAERFAPRPAHDQRSRVRPRVRDGDWLAALEACPVSMDDLPRRRREDSQSRL